MLRSVLLLIVILGIVLGKETPSKDDATNKLSNSNYREKLFFKSVSTQSHTIVSFSTSTLFFSCFNGVSTAVGGAVTTCPGRKKKRRRSIKNMEDLHQIRWGEKYTFWWSLDSLISKPKIKSPGSESIKIEFLKLISCNNICIATIIFSSTLRWTWTLSLLLIYRLELILKQIFKWWKLNRCLDVYYKVA